MRPGGPFRIYGRGPETMKKIAATAPTTAPATTPVVEGHATDTPAPQVPLTGHTRVARNLTMINADIQAACQACAGGIHITAEGSLGCAKEPALDCVLLRGLQSVRQDKTHAAAAYMTPDWIVERLGTVGDLGEFARIEPAQQPPSPATNDTRSAD